MHELLTCCSIATALIIWFKTEAVQEYATLFRIGHFFFFPLYEKERKKNPILSYFDYINLYHDCFLTRLVSCPFCLVFWFSIIASLISFSFLMFPLYYVGSLSIYGLVSKIHSE